MAKVYLLNAFSLSMLPVARFGRWFHIYVREVNPEEAKDLIKEFQNREFEIESAIGHPATAKLLSSILDYEVKYERKRITLEPKKEPVYALVIQLFERLPEGKALDYNEILEMFAKGKVKLIWLEIHDYFLA